MWHVAVDSVWAEFVAPGCPHRPVPLLDAAPLQCWIYAKPEEVAKPGQQEKKPEVERPSRKLLAEYYGTSNEEEEAAAPAVSLHVLALSSQLVSLQLDHHQLLFLLRLAESLGELGAFLAADSARIEARPAGMVLGAVLPQVSCQFSGFLTYPLPQVDLSIILPVSASPGQEGEDSEGDSVLDTTMEELLQDPLLPEQPLLTSSPSLGLGQGENLSHPLASEVASHPLASGVASHPLASKVASHPLASEVASHPLASGVATNPLARAVASHPLSPIDAVSSEGTEGVPPPSLPPLPGRPSLLSNGLPPQPPPKVTLCPTLSR